MAKNPVKRAQTVILPPFHIPEGVDELVYADVYQEGAGEYEVLDDISDKEDDGRPDAPDTFTIVKQTVSKTKDGHQVVDVVAEVEDVKGVIRYEYRLTKEGKA